MKLGEFFSFGKIVAADEDCGIEEIFKLNLNADDFSSADIVNTYKKILTDVADRTHGLTDDQKQALFDSCLKSENSKGLITLLACAMKDKSDLFLVWNKATKVIMKATQEQEAQIKKDYETKAESSTGVYISFKNYTRTDMIKIYCNFEYCVLASLNKNLNVSKALQYKINELRSSVALSDSTVAKAQAKSVVDALGKGKDVMMDKNDEISSPTPDMEATEKSIQFLDAKKAWILDMPMSYISGYQTEGIGSTGEADMRAVERGLKNYFVSIVQPVLKAVFGATTTFKSQDFRLITGVIEVLKAFDLVSDNILSVDAKREIIQRLLELDPKKEAKAIEESEDDESDPDVTNGFTPPQQFARSGSQ